MANPKRDLYLAIRQQILNEVKEIKHVLFYNNQFDRDNEEEAFLYPNCFIEFNQMLWTSTTQGQQRGDIDVKVYLGFERYETESLTIFDTIQNVFVALQGFATGVLFSPLNRIEEEQDVNHDNVIVWTITFKTSLIECESDTRTGLTETTIATLEILKEIDIDNEVIRTGDGDFS